MNGRVAAFVEWMGDAFWVRPTLLALAGVVLAEVARRLEAPGIGPLPSGLVFAGDIGGAQSLLAVIGGSAIGVAGTIFSITIAALSFTSGQMGPRLLRNFVRDPGNQWALGVFLLTFAYTIALHRGMGAPDTPTVPHLGLALAVALALGCTVVLAWFVHHVATGINVEAVIDLVHAELRDTVARLTTDAAPEHPTRLPMPPPRGEPVRCAGAGYLRAIDYPALAAWAAENGAVLSVVARPGDYLHAAARIAEVVPADTVEGAAAALRGAMTLGPRPAAAQDLEFAVRQLVEVAVRALSPGINDPFTAMAVLDRLGAVLAGLAPRHLLPAALLREGRVVLYRRVTDYGGLCDTMFHMIRQAGAGQAAVLIRLVEVLGEVADIEDNPARRSVLQRHARLAFGAGLRGIADEAGRADLGGRYAAFVARG